MRTESNTESSDAIILLEPNNAADEYITVAPAQNENLRTSMENSEMPGNQDLSQNRIVPTVVMSQRREISRSSKKGLGVCGAIFLLIIVIIKIIRISSGGSSTKYNNLDFDINFDSLPHDNSKDSEHQYGGGYEISLPSRSKSYRLENLSISYNLSLGSCNTIVCKNAVHDLIDSLDKSVDPCDNFYEFSCQGWHKNNPRPSYMAKWNVFSKAEKETEDVMRAILEKSSTDVNSPALETAKEFYKKCIDVTRSGDQQDKIVMKSMWDTLEMYGGWPILYKKGTWKSSRFNWMKSVADLKRLFGRSLLLDISPFQSPDGNKSRNMILIKNPSSTPSGKSSIAQISGSGTLTPTIKNIITFIRDVSKELLVSKGTPNINETYLEEKALEILIVQSKLLDIEEKVANKAFKRSKGLNGDEAEITVDNLQTILDKYVYILWDNELKMKELLDTLYGHINEVKIAKNEKLYITDVDYILELSTFLSYVKPEVLANYLHFQMVFEMASMTTGKMQTYFDKLDNSLDGTTEQRSRSSVCTAITEEKFAHILGQVYVKQKYPNVNDSVHDFVEAGQIFKSIKQSVSEIIIHSSNIPFYKKVSLLSHADFTYMCTGFPSWIYDDVKMEAEYEGLDINQPTFLEQNLAVNAWSTDKKLKSLREAIDVETDECTWDRFVGSPGAFNQIFRYLVYMPLGIIQPPFFGFDFPSVLNYARLGFIMGHELTHGLTSGLSELENGVLTPSAECFVQHYNKYSTDELRKQNITLNGKLTLSENIPDNVGLLEAYQAYKNLNESSEYGYNRPELLGNYTNDQIFFIGFAQTFCESATVENMKRSIKRDEHSPGRFRVLATLRNSKEFAESWNCPLGSKMNPFPSDHEKCSIL